MSTATKRPPSDTQSTEAQAVNEYLTLLHSPRDLIDWEEVTRVRELLEVTEDPIERLELRAKLDALGHLDHEAYEVRFIAHAKAWADAVGVGPAAFLAEGVDYAVLRRAGFRMDPKPRKRKK